MSFISNNRHFRKFKRNFSDYGIRVVFRKGLSYLSRGVFQKRTYRIFMTDIEDWNKPAVTRDDFSFFLMDGSNKSSDLIRQIESAEEWLEGEIENKLIKGSLCLLALDGTKIAGFNLVSFGNIFIPLLEETISLQPEEAWSEQVSVLKEYRRRGLARDLRYNIFGILTKRKIKWFYGGVLVSNKASLRLNRSVGVTKSVDIHLIKVLGRKRLQCEDFMRQKKSILKKQISLKEYHPHTIY